MLLKPTRDEWSPPFALRVCRPPRTACLRHADHGTLGAQATREDTNLHVRVSQWLSTRLGGVFVSPVGPCVTQGLFSFLGEKEKTFLWRSSGFFPKKWDGFCVIRRDLLIFLTKNDEKTLTNRQKSCMIIKGNLCAEKQALFSEFRRGKRSKPMQRFFVTDDAICGGVIRIEGDDARHISFSLRSRVSSKKSISPSSIRD